MCLRIYGYFPELAACDPKARPPESVNERRERYGFGKRRGKAFRQPRKRKTADSSPR